MINTAYCSARPPLVLLPSFPSCHVSICQCLKSTMLCQRCTLTPSKKKKSKKKKHTFCSLGNARPSEIKIPFHFCLKNLLPILNAMNYSTLYDFYFFFLFTKSESGRLEGDKLAYSDPLQKSGSAGLRPTGS